MKIITEYKVERSTLSRGVMSNDHVSSTETNRSSQLAADPSCQLSYGSVHVTYSTATNVAINAPLIQVKRGYELSFVH